MLISFYYNICFLLVRLHYGLIRRRLYALIDCSHPINLSADLIVKNPSNLHIGKNTNIGPKVTIGAFAPVWIGENVTISQDVLIETGGLVKGTKKHFGKEIVIKDNAWIGARAVILSGVTIGCGARVGAGAVVRSDVDDYTTVI